MKKILLLSLIVLAMAGGARAADTIISMPLSQWASSPVQVVGDKVITFQASSLDGATGIVFSVFDLLPGQITIDIKPQTTVANYYMDYSIAIDRTKSPSGVFEQVSLISDNGSAQGTVVAKNVIEAGLLLSHTTGPAVTGAISGGLYSLNIHETFNGGGYLASATNTFTATPEPMTLGLFGIGVLFLRRRMA